MDHLLHFVLLLAALPFTMQQSVEVMGACECAVFPIPTSKPLIERTLQYNVSCTEEGEETCKTLCAALAESARDKAHQMICERLKGHVKNLQVSVFAKICKAGVWQFTGLETADPICCHEGSAIPCKED